MVLELQTALPSSFRRAACLSSDVEYVFPRIFPGPRLDMCVCGTTKALMSHGTASTQHH